MDYMELFLDILNQVFLHPKKQNILDLSSGLVDCFLHALCTEILVDGFSSLSLDFERLFSLLGHYLLVVSQTYQNMFAHFTRHDKFLWSARIASLTFPVIMDRIPVCLKHQPIPIIGPL
jgi:hypothetical protein